MVSKQVKIEIEGEVFGTNTLNICPSRAASSHLKTIKVYDKRYFTQPDTIP